MQRAGTLTCRAAGKGFGEASQQRGAGGKGGKQKQQGVKSADGKAVQRAVKLVEQQQGRQQRGGGARPVDPREAARGKVEYVKVKDWGSGEPEDLGSLRLDSEATQMFAADGTAAEEAMPFHEVLARRLEALQAPGTMRVTQADGKPLPPFERWAFTQQHYEEYLADMYAVHDALEKGLVSAARAEREAAAAAGGADKQRREQLLAALDLFGAEQGLARSAALQQDLQRLAGRQQQAAQGPAEQQQASSSGGGGGDGWQPPAATQPTAAYAAYIASLPRLQQAADAPQEAEQAVLRLLAHAYVLYLTHLTSGGRIGGAAASKLDLVAADALQFYRDYPLLPESARPLEQFVQRANRLGQLLGGDQQEALMQELGKALLKTSTLLVPLAREA